MKKFELLDHTADIKMRVFGGSLEKVFENAAYGMASIQIEDLKSKVNNKDFILQSKRIIKVESIDIETLLVDFLSEILTLSDTYQESYPKVSNIKMIKNRIEAEIEGFKVHRFDEDIKAVTYHEAKVEEKNGDWFAEIIFDI